MKRSLVCTLSVLALALALPVLAQSELTTSGTVVSSSATQIVVKTADGRQMTFMVDADSKVPGNLQQGTAVTVRYHDMNGTLHAANVSAAAGTSTTPSTGVAPTSSTPTGTSATSAAEPTRPAADPTGNDARTTTVPPPAAPPATTTAPAAPSAPAPTTSAMPEDADSTRMPATASPLPLVGLSGLLALAGGLGARALRRRK